MFLEVLLVTPDRLLFEGTAISVVLPGEEGVFEVMPYHKPILSRLIPGKVIIDNNQMFHIRRGIAGVNLNKLSVIVEE